MLAEVYMELLGGRQNALTLIDAASEALAQRTRIHRAPRVHTASADELAAHAAMLAELTGAMWLNDQTV